MSVIGKETYIEPKVRDRNSRLRVYVEEAVPPEDAITQQQFKDECDMNRIVNNAKRGIAPKYLARGTPQYGDFSDVPDLTEARNRIERAESAFMNLPAELRLELGNDPVNIGKITEDQIKRYKLRKEPLPPSAAVPDAPSAGQAQPAGTEPAAPTPPKGGAKKSSKDDG